MTRDTPRRRGSSRSTRAAPLVLGIAAGAVVAHGCGDGFELQDAATSTSAAGTSSTSGGGEGGATGASTSAGAGGATSTAASTSTGAAGGGGEGEGGAGGVACDPAATAGYPLEVEPNDDVASATPLPGGALGLWGSLCPAGDVDVFAVTSPGGQSLTVAVTDGNGGCPPGFQPWVRVLDPGGALVAEDTGFGCTALDPGVFPALASLAPGTFHVVVESAGSLAVPAYRVELALQSPGCGDGVVQAAQGEQCDDANGASGDGCSACQLEADHVSEVEPNDTFAFATPVGASEGGTGSLGVSDVDHFSFVVAQAGSSVTALVSDGFGSCPPGLATFLTLHDPFGNGLVVDADSGPAGCSSIDPAAYPAATALPAGTYSLSVSEVNGSVAAAYVLSIDVHPPGCGDASVQAGEQCDDGNVLGGDGCSALCKVEAPWEIEPNASMATATPLWPGTNGWYGTIKPIGDVDWFSFTVAAGAKVTLETSDLGSVLCTYDTLIHLVKSNGVEVASDDDGGASQCSKMGPVTHPALNNMAAGTYFVWVQELFNGGVIPGYELHFTVQ